MQMFNVTFKLNLIAYQLTSTSTANVLCFKYSISIQRSHNSSPLAGLSLFFLSNNRHILQIHQLRLLHFRKTRFSSKLSVMRALFGFIINPLCEKIRSTGAELAGTQNTLSNSGLIKLTSSRMYIVSKDIGFDANAAELIKSK